jgi:hypothetical protein
MPFLSNICEVTGTGGADGEVSSSSIMWTWCANHAITPPSRRFYLVDSPFASRRIGRCVERCCARCALSRSSRPFVPVDTGHNDLTRVRRAQDNARGYITGSVKAIEFRTYSPAAAFLLLFSNSEMHSDSDSSAEVDSDCSVDITMQRMPAPPSTHRRRTASGTELDHAMRLLRVEHAAQSEALVTEQGPVESSSKYTTACARAALCALFSNTTGLAVSCACPEPNWPSPARGKFLGVRRR